jgi:Spy/CpxP family protein refolding chaperone
LPHRQFGEVRGRFWSLVLGSVGFGELSALRSYDVAIHRRLRMRTVVRVALVVAFALCVCLAADSAFGQQPGGRGGRGGRGGGFGGGFGGGGPGGGGATQLLQDENVRRELDLVDEQVSKLRDIATKMQEDMQAQFQGFDFGSLRDLSEEERTARFAEMRKKGEEVAASAQKEIDGVLLPHQRERLKQLMVQSQMRFGADRALTGGTLAEELGITEDQKEALAKKQEEVQASLQEKMAKLRQEAQDELLSVLTPAQQAKLKSMVGEPFTFAQGGGPGGGFGGPGGGGFGGGGRGGFGGDAGGRGGRGRGGEGGRGGTRLERPADGD